MKIAFLDRDGTLMFEPQDTGKIDTLKRLKILPGVIEGLKQLQADDYKFVLISNQNGIGTPNFLTEAFEIPNRKFLEILRDEGIEFYRIFVCPHMQEDNCNCRKPETGLVDEFLKDEQIDFAKSFMLGDRFTDVEFGENVGVIGLKMLTNSRFPRITTAERETNETKVFALANLDGIGSFKIDTGIKFFNHMLEQFSKHSLIDLVIKTQGDLDVDEHHAVEDTALVLGEVINKALGAKRGIKRYGFTLPMDDTLVEVAVDLGGRAYLVFNVSFLREKVGDLPTELVEHFFRSLADSLRANIHINVCYGRNEHHKI